MSWPSDHFVTTSEPGVATTPTNCAGHRRNAQYGDIDDLIPTGASAQTRVLPAYTRSRPCTTSARRSARRVRPPWPARRPAVPYGRVERVVRCEDPIAHHGRTGDQCDPDQDREDSRFIYRPAIRFSRARSVSGSSMLQLPKPTQSGRAGPAAGALLDQRHRIPWWPVRGHLGHLGAVNRVRGAHQHVEKARGVRTRLGLRVPDRVCSPAVNLNGSCGPGRRRSRRPARSGSEQLGGQPAGTELGGHVDPLGRLPASVSSAPSSPKVSGISAYPVLPASCAAADELLRPGCDPGRAWRPRPRPGRPRRPAGPRSAARPRRCRR